MWQKTKGFTLIELMITVAIVGILAVTAMPAYQSYTRKAHFSEIVQAAGPYQLAVTECFINTGEFTGCDGDKQGIPKNMTSSVGAIAKLDVSHGVITVTPKKQNGLEETDTYILEPAEKNNMITWKSAGGGVDKGYAK